MLAPVTAHPTPYPRASFTSAYANDLECDDGSTGNYAYCACGTDCSDCGSVTVDQCDAAASTSTYTWDDDDYASLRRRRMGTPAPTPVPTPLPPTLTYTPHLALDLRYRDGGTGALGTASCVAAAALPHGSRAPWASVVVRAVAPNRVQLLLNGTVACDLALCASCVPLVRQEAFAPVAAAAAAGPRSFATGSVFAPAVNTTWRDTALGDVYELRWYEATALSDATARAMSAWDIDAKVTPQHECDDVDPDEDQSSGSYRTYSCYMYIDGDGSWEVVSNAGLMEKGVVAAHMNRFGSSGGNFITFAYDWGWGSPTITVDKLGGIWADLGTSSHVGDVIMYKGPGESAFSMAVDTVEGGVLDCCFSIDVAALCEIKFGDVSNQMAPGTNVHYNKEDGHMYASGADVRRWLPTARKWSLPIAQSVGAGNRDSAPSEARIALPRVADINILRYGRAEQDGVNEVDARSK